ncbi:DUF4157 domain-containing protein [Okeania sp. SIO2B3]|uniref:eCIS core domain-containing protein n=1 Tax=Okeania sp. SIO2B3 TaxID=2607784 RepID=UPI0025F7968C|nr:DUF4157 domain-containing protein [Okeania sp. SIO2B3]
MGNLGKQQVRSRQVPNIGQRKSIFQESKFPPVVQNVAATSATTNLSGYRKPKTGEMIANVMGNLSQSNYSPPPSYMNGKQLQVPKPQQREAHIAPVHQLKGPPQSSFPTAQVPPNKTGLPDRLKAGVENLSGYSLDNVRVHYNSSKPAQLQALAYTQGTDIHVAPGQEKHLPHETWHVVQQMQGRVKPTMQMKGVQVNDDVGLEKEADMMGPAAILKQNNVEGTTRSISFHSSVVQRIELNNNVIVSSFDRSKFVNEENAIITTSATQESFTGGHAMMFLEILDEDNLANTFLIHLTTPGDGTINVDIKQLQIEYNPSSVSSLFFSRRIEGELRIPAKTQSYVVDRQKGFIAMALARQIGDDPNNRYILSGSKFLNLNPFSSVTYMNCSDFVEKILNEVGVSISGGILSRPSVVSEKDTRTNEQIYREATKL